MLNLAVAAFVTLAFVRPVDPPGGPPAEPTPKPAPTALWYVARPDLTKCPPSDPVVGLNVIMQEFVGADHPEFPTRGAYACTSDARAHRFVPAATVPHPGIVVTAAPSPTPSPTAAPAPVVEPVFPITASQFDSLTHGTGGQMTTDVSIDASGRLNATTHTHEMTELHGFNGVVSVIVTDEQNVIWTSQAHTFGVEGVVWGHSDRTDSWGEQIPPDVVSHIRGVAIAHVANNPAADLANSLHVFVSNIARAVHAVVGKVAAGVKGDITAAVAAVRNVRDSIEQAIGPDVAVGQATVKQVTTAVKK